MMVIIKTIFGIRTAQVKIAFATNTLSFLHLTKFTLFIDFFTQPDLESDENRRSEHRKWDVFPFFQY